MEPACPPEHRAPHWADGRWFTSLSARPPRPGAAGWVPRLLRGFQFQVGSPPARVLWSRRRRSAAPLSPTQTVETDSRAHTHARSRTHAHTRTHTHTHTSLVLPALSRWLLSCTDAASPHLPQPRPPLLRAGPPVAIRHASAHPPAARRVRRLYSLRGHAWHALRTRQFSVRRRRLATPADSWTCNVLRWPFCRRCPP